MKNKPHANLPFTPTIRRLWAHIPEPRLGAPGDDSEEGEHEKTQQF